MPAIAEIIQEVLSLPLTDRTYLAEKLLESLDLEDQPGPEWVGELRRRARDIDEGRAKLVPSAEAWEQVNGRFGTDFKP